MSAEESRSPVIARFPAAIRRLDPAVAISFACIILLLLIGSLYNSEFLSLDYLLQQLKVASFLGVIATGMMIVAPHTGVKREAAFGRGGSFSSATG